MDNWFKYQGAILFSAHYEPTREEALHLVKANRALFARWTSEFDCPQPTEWWYCIRDQYIPLEQYTAKQRYRIRKGLNTCEITHLTTQQISEYQDEIFRVAQDSFADYPPQYRPRIEQQSFIQEITSQPNLDFWLCRLKTDGTACGYGYCRRKSDIAELTQVKVPTRYLATEVNAALAHTITEYYLKDECGICYISDGERNIRHETNYQEFLVRVLNFRYAYCRLNVVYHPLFRVALLCASPFEKVFEWLGKRSNLCYNVYCTIRQDKIQKGFYHE